MSILAGKTIRAISVQVFCACIPAVKNTCAPESFFQDQEAVSYVVVTESIQAQNVSFDQFFMQRAGVVSACGTSLFER